MGTDGKGKGKKEERMELEREGVVSEKRRGKKNVENESRILMGEEGRIINGKGNRRKEKVNID